MYGSEYKRAGHIKSFCAELEHVESTGRSRLASSMPPRHSKSWTLRAYVAWCIGRHPKWQIIYATSSDSLAMDAGREIRDMVASEEFRAIFPGVELRADSQAASRFHTNHGGIFLAVGLGTRIQGRGVNLGIIDDPIGDPRDADSEAKKASLWQWYSPGFYSRLMPDGRVVVNHTRWREDDLIGRVLKEHAHQNWRVVNYPAILPNGEALWPEFWPLEVLLDIKETSSTRDWEAVYQGRPTADEGGILKRHWWQRWSRSEPPPIEHVVLSLDTAFSEKDSADFSAATVWGYFRSKDTEDDTKSPKVYDNIILLDAWQGRVDFPDLRAQCKALIKKHEPDTVLIEKKASGQSLIQELRRQGIPVVAYTPDRDKVARAYSVQSIFESDCVWAPAGKSFADMVIDQCAAFPTGAHDDLVDCTVQALIRFRQSGRLSLDTDPFDEPAPKEPRKRDFSYYA
jgi:predicted phage terminase large subunit-like protein